jgi:hypothetical protein
MIFFVLSLSSSQAGKRANDEYTCRVALYARTAAKESDL